MALKENLNILYINIRSLRNKIDELQNIIFSHKKTIHLIILTETWIYPNEINLFDIPSYKAVHDCRNTRGGGTSIFINDNIKFEYQIEQKINLEDCNTVSLYLPKQKITILSIYRPPKNNCKLFIPELDKILEKQKKNSLCLLVTSILIF